MWTDNTTFYQIYPLGLCGALSHNDRLVTPRIRKLIGWIPHLQRLGVGAVYIGPLFASDQHGYDTRDYRLIDERLGSAADFADVCRAFHTANIGVVLDGVFNHVGRSFWAFDDLRRQRANSRYASWFHVNFNENNALHDGFSYRCWEGHTSLPALNQANDEVVQHIFDCIANWIRDFDIDGLRLDVAYCLPDNFIRRLRVFCDGQKAGFFLLGEMIHGDYKRLLSDATLHSVTNYQLYKGLWSSLNDLNMFELAYTLDEQRDKYAHHQLFTFVDNHDVTRAASVLINPAHLRLLYALLFAVPGIPCLYYGSEWGATGVKQHGASDEALRPAFDAPTTNALSGFIAHLSYLRRVESALHEGVYEKILLTNRQFIFVRRDDTRNERVYVAVNADSEPSWARLDIDAARDLLTEQDCRFTNGGYLLPPHSVFYWKRGG